MTRTTTALGQQLAVPGTGEQFSTVMVNGDLTTLETAIFSDRARLTTIEGWDVSRPGANGSAMFLAADVATLDALATALVGDQSLLANPGTGADPYAVMTAISGTGASMIWRLSQDLIVDTKAHLDAIVTAWSTTSLQFEVGRRVFVTGTLVTYRFSSTAGALVRERNYLNLNYVLTASNTFSNPTTPADFSNATDLAALTKTFTKQEAGTSLLVRMSVPLAFASGAAQVLGCAINIAGTATKVASAPFLAAPADGMVAGEILIAGAAAGALTVKPQVYSGTASSIQANAGLIVSYTIEEIPA
jgi:hypothetical protein